MAALFGKKNGMQIQPQYVALWSVLFHEGSAMKHVWITHLPPNTTSYMQPLDQRIIYSLKHSYSKCLACYFWGN